MKVRARQINRALARSSLTLSLGLHPTPPFLSGCRSPPHPYLSQSSSKPSVIVLIAYHSITTTTYSFILVHLLLFTHPRPLISAHHRPPCSHHPHPGHRSILVLVTDRNNGDIPLTQLQIRIPAAARPANQSLFPHHHSVIPPRKLITTRPEGTASKSLREPWPRLPGTILCRSPCLFKYATTQPSPRSSYLLSSPLSLVRPTRTPRSFAPIHLHIHPLLEPRALFPVSQGPVITTSSALLQPNSTSFHHTSTTTLLLSTFISSLRRIILSFPAQLDGRPFLPFRTSLSSAT